MVWSSAGYGAGRTRTDPPPAPAAPKGDADGEHQGEPPWQSLKKPDSLAADKARSNGPCRHSLRRRGIRHTIPEKTDSQAARRRKGRRGGRPPGFDKQRYKKRNTVERAINKLKQFRAVATRYDKRGYGYLGTVTTAALVIWLRT